jgi:predicted transcriptional regulator of viral defense system
MTFQEFKSKIADFPVFSTSHVNSLGGNQQVLRNQLTRWQKRGLVIKLKRGLYVLNKTDRRITPSRMFLANQLYQPSYVSTEYALAFYDIIPERVFDVTSVSTRKTNIFENEFGHFMYQHIKQEGYTGFNTIQDEHGYTCFISTPEKALVDFCYLNQGVFKKESFPAFDSLRLQNIGQLTLKKIIGYARTFDNTGFMRIITMLVNYIKETTP